MKQIDRRKDYVLTWGGLIDMPITLGNLSSDNEQLRENNILAFSNLRRTQITDKACFDG